jgi:uncharacterized membrane protein AbrB (regulator of aidB expression)
MACHRICFVGTRITGCCCLDTRRGAPASVIALQVGEPLAAVFLAFAPGGLAEMGLIALSLQMSVIYVTAHHVARIVLAVTVARLFWRKVES